MKHLTKDNFAEEIKSGLVFVKFATKTGCRPCAEFKAKYEQAEDDKAKFCTYERETLPKGESDLDEIEKKYQISSFPTILVFQDGELKGTMPKYKFYSNRDLAWMILDEQKKLYNQQCFVEDLTSEMQSRTQAPVLVAPSDEEYFDKNIGTHTQAPRLPIGGLKEDFTLPTPTVNQDELVPCTSCQ